jgi:hypothetical protein
MAQPTSAQRENAIDNARRRLAGSPEKRRSVRRLDPPRGRSRPGSTLIAKLQAENQRLRAKLLELAKTCSHCEGTFVVNDGRKQVDCRDCADIREFLK